ncbi:MAG: hydroxymethylpyrimidine/phosphomethylpyrimidine kinase [Deltaproteobacteria bacterium]|nr:hydroxymethylpyrimidine/phosphomethylpyrimidine kinase [Deltaproteobacteria bacterium]MBW2532621.1 hydroxymethylpyrimidine/phosphomethylpyrimidine kinase [Deltaproteobacteria bacterium]
MEGRVLLVGSSDSSGGSGIQADLKTAQALGVHGCSAIAMLAAQDTVRVHEMVPVAPPFVARQMQVALEDIGADCVKTGLLPAAETIEAVVRALERHGRSVPVVVHPAMLARGGAPRLDDAALSALRLRLVGSASLVALSRFEAEALCQVSIGTKDELDRAADVVLGMGAGAVFLHAVPLEDCVVDLLRTADGDEARYTREAPVAEPLVGVGATLATAIASFVARGLRLGDAVDQARQYGLAAARGARLLGAGAPLLDHPCFGPGDDSGLTH